MMLVVGARLCDSRKGGLWYTYQRSDTIDDVCIFYDPFKSKFGSLEGVLNISSGLDKLMILPRVFSSSGSRYIVKTSFASTLSRSSSQNSAIVIQVASQI